MSKKCVKCGYSRLTSDVAPDYECPKCGVIYAKAEAALVNGTLLQVRPRAQVPPPNPDPIPSKFEDENGPLVGDIRDEDFGPNLSNDYLAEIAVPPFSKMLGIVGSLVLFLGVFAPIVRLPIVGSMNYFRNGSGDGVILVVMAILSLIFVFREKPAKLFWTASGSLATLTFTFVYFNWKLHEMKSEMDKSLQGNPFRGLADLAQSSIQIEWGWIVLVLGTGLLFLSAITNKLQIYSFIELLRVVPGAKESGKESVRSGGQSGVSLASDSLQPFSGKDSITDELLKLNELLKAGALTKSEFDDLKRRLLK